MNAITEAMPTARAVTFARCPCCEHELNASVNYDTCEFYSPKSGDLTVCLFCAQPLVFLVGLHGLELAQANLETFAPDVRARLEHALRELVAMREAVFARIGGDV